MKIEGRINSYNGDGMRLLRVVMVLLAVYSTTAMAQRKVLLNEDFNNNSNEWRVGETPDGHAEMEISDGVYKITEEDDSGFRFFGIKAPINMKKNFSITMRIRQTDGSDDNGFGLVFFAKDNDNHQQFLISTNEWARFGRYKEGEYLDVAKWTKISSVKDMDEWNTLEVVKINDALTCWVNGKYFSGTSGSYMYLGGEGIGVLYQKALTIEVDKITVEQWEPDPIRVVEGANPNAVKVNLGPGVNSKGYELVDCVSPDGSVLVFSSDHTEVDPESKAKRDIYFSTRGSNGEWSKAQNAGAPLNNDFHNFAIAITQDLNTLFVQGVYNGSSSTTTGVSYSNRTKNGWSDPVSMPIDNMYNHGNYINSHISPDGQTMLISLQRDDTRGGNDIYLCKRRADDSWTEPVNLGDVVNTTGSETGPFIAADGATVYFASNGHPGYEGLDVFITRRLDETWLKWSVPENLGTGVNTDEHDSFFQVPAKGDSGYYSSHKNSLGSGDVFSVALPKAAKPIPLFMVKGRVLNAETKQPIEGQVVYQELPSATRAGTAHSSPVDGAYQVALVKGKLYGVHAEATGYFPHSEQFDARELGTYSEVEKDLLLTPIKSNVAIRLNNVFFDFGKFDLRPESFPELDRLVELLVNNPSYKIALSGHTDNVGTDAANVLLSQNRINSVRDYILTKGVDASRLTAKGYGKTKPVATNDTEEGRQENRRVEFTIL